MPGYKPGEAQRQLAATYENLQTRIKAAGKRLRDIELQTAEQAAQQQAARRQAEQELTQLRQQIEKARKEAARNDAKAEGRIRGYNTRIETARNALRAVREQVEQAKAEADAESLRAARARTELNRYIRSTVYAEQEYAAAVAAHPEDTIKGPSRLRALNNEVASITRNRRKQQHQEAA